MKTVKAVYAVAMKLGIEILEVEHGASEKIIWKWSNEKKIHKSVVRDVNGRPCFRANRQWIPLDECMAVS